MKYEKVSREKIYSICSELSDKVPALMQALNIDFMEFPNRVTFPCPIHGGDNGEGACIFIDGSKTKGNWRCWTHCCEKDFGQNMIGFIRGVLSKKEGKEVNFYRALNFSLSFLNKKILDIPEEKISETIHEINKVNELVNRRPEKNNLNLSREQVIQTLNIPSEYYIGRGYLPETLVAFDVGECYNSSKQMHNRAVVPIYDIDGSYAGCTGRALNDETKPKWFNSKGFKKALYLYGVSVTMPYIKQTNTVVLVEGQGDVWRLYEAGIKNCAGIFGSDLSEDQLVALEEMEIFNIVILTDTDEAGEKAAEGIKNKGGRRFNYYRPKISKKDIGEMTIEEINTELKPQIKGLF